MGARAGVASLLALGLVATQPGRQLGAKGHQPILAELGVADLQHFSHQVHVTPLEASDFTHPQAKTREQCKDHLVAGTPQLSA